MKHIAFTAALFAAAIFYASALVLSIRIAITTGMPGADTIPTDGPLSIVFLAVAVIATTLTINLGKDL